MAGRTKKLYQPGDRIGKWTIVASHGQNKHGMTVSLADCDCGNKGVVVINANLRAGISNSCRACSARFSRNHRKLTEQQVIEIKQKLCEGFRQHELGKQYGVERSTIGGISLDRTWAFVPWPENHKMLKRKTGTSTFTYHEALDVKRRLAEGESQTSIANDLGVKHDVINKIFLGKTYIHVPWPNDPR